MRRLLLLAWLLPALFCSAQILIQPNPHATSYIMLAGQPPRAVISVLTSDERAKFQQVYNAVLRDNATLDAEGDTLTAKANDYQKVLKAAMVKADPSVGPVLAGMSTGPLTQAQTNAIRQAQADAIHVDPTLQSQWADLTAKMGAHQQAVDAAMVKADPTMAPILSKLSP
jgi:hypothetical protein